MERLKRENIFESDRLHLDLARRSIRGSITTMSGQGIRIILNVIATAILARLLTPKDYGLISMVVVITGFAEMFKDAGLSMATVQKDNITHEQISTLFWINVLITGFLGLCILAGSPLVAEFYKRPELKGVTAALSISFILTGLTIQHQALLKRHMQFSALVLIQIASQFMSILITIILALIGWRYWALVAGTITMALVGTSMTLFFCPWFPGKIKKGTGVRNMLKFGGHLTGSNTANYFSGNLDSILIGKFIGADALGLYAKAYQLFMAPILQIRLPLHQVAMPLLAVLKNQPERYIKYYQRLVDILATLTIPLALYCVIEAEFLIRLFLGLQWMGSVPVFRILAIAGMITPVAGTWGIVTVSLGFSDRYFYWGIINCFVMIPAFLIGLPFGIKGVAMAYTIATYIMLIPSLSYCFKGTPITVSLFMKTLITPFLTSILAAGSVILMKNINSFDTNKSHFVGLAVFMLIYASACFGRKSVRETITMIRESIL